MVKSMEMMLVNNSNKIKLVCRIKDFSQETEIFWRKDGKVLTESQDRIKIRTKRYKNISLTVSAGIVHAMTC